MSSLAEQVFGKKRSTHTPQWDARGAPAAAPVGAKLRSTRAQERLEAQRSMYVSLLSNPTQLSVEEVKQRALVAATAAAHRDEEDEDLDIVFERACRRLYLLWDQVGVENDVRQHIKAMALTGPPTVQGLRILHDEISRLSNARAAEKAIATAIESRESFLYLLHDAVERAAGTDAAQRKDIKVSPLINSVRRHGFEVVEATLEWRRHLGYEALYLWRGTSYLVKMVTDMHFLLSSPLLSRVGCAIAGNPMMNPARKPESSTPNLSTKASMAILNATTSSQGGSGVPPQLPPLQYRAAGPFGALPAKKSSSDGASSLLYTPERYADAEATLRREPSLLKQYLATKTVVRFEDNSVAGSEPDVDPHILKGLEEVRFVPEDINEVIEEQSKQATEGQRQTGAAMIIQRIIRGVIGRRLGRERRQQHHAARKIQGLYRYWAARRRANWLRSRKNAAAVLQSLARGASTRTRTKDNAIHNAAAARIQGLYRGWVGRRNFQMWKQVWYCAVAIQRTYRSFISRRATLKYKKTTYDHAASDIQKVWKGRQLRQRGEADPKRLKAATRIQAAVRRYQALDRYRHLQMLNLQSSKVTAVMKGHLVRQQMRALRPHDYEDEAAGDEASDFRTE